MLSRAALVMTRSSSVSCYVIVFSRLKGARENAVGKEGFKTKVVDCVDVLKRIKPVLNEIVCPICFVQCNAIV